MAIPGGPQGRSAAADHDHANYVPKWRSSRSITLTSALVRCPIRDRWPRGLIIRRLWERYDVTRRSSGQKKTFHHPHVGTITFAFQGMQLEGTPGQRLGVYVAEPGTPDYDAMVLLDMTALTHAGQSVVQNSPDSRRSWCTNGRRRGRVQTLKAKARLAEAWSAARRPVARRNPEKLPEVKRRF